MSKVHWLIGAALTMLVAGPAMSQEKAEPAKAAFGVIRIEGQPAMQFQQMGPNVTVHRVESGEPITVQASGDGNVMFFGPGAQVGKYWLGVQCSPVPPALRSHVTLPEKQGLLVIAVSKDSPAAKAGLAQYDILLRVGDKPVDEPRDLVSLVEAAKEAKMKIDVIRGGKPKTIEVAPAKRPVEATASAGHLEVQVPEQGDWNTVEKWLEGTAQGQGAPRGPFQFRVFGPGAIVPKEGWAPKPLPPNTNINIMKENDQPAKITVKSGDKKWDVTEKELDKLPADIRPHVEQMLGHGVFGIIGAATVPPGMSGGLSGSGTMQLPPMTPPGMMQGQPFPGNMPQSMEKRLDEMNRRMDQLFKMMEELNQGRTPPPAAEHHEEK
jgi:membrane-associated protease RseP (regulator of RpoE activity)